MDGTPGLNLPVPHTAPSHRVHRSRGPSHMSTHRGSHLMFCRRHPLGAAARQERGEPTAAIWRKSLNVRTPMGNRRAAAVAAIRAASSGRGGQDPGCEWEAEPGGSAPRPGAGGSRGVLVPSLKQNNNSHVASAQRETSSPELRLRPLPLANTS